MGKIENKRSYFRVDSMFEVKVNSITDRSDTIKIGSQKNTGPKIGKSMNVSASGVLFSYHEKLEIGSIVQVSFLKPNTFDIFKGNAQIVRIELQQDSELYEIGIDFIDLKDDEKETLNYFLTK